MIDDVYLQGLRSRRSSLETELALPATAANHRRLRELTREHARLRGLEEAAARLLDLRRQVADNETLQNDESVDDELREMAGAELDALRQSLDAAEREVRLALIPPDPDDARNVIMEIRAGTGGEEAALFAGDLFRLYCRYAELRGWKTQVLDANPTSLGGFKEVVFSVEGQDVYKWLKYESGGHRVQRVPETEASGRIHTSAATVAVLAEADDLDEIDVRPDDLRVDTYRASGSGGQHVNKTDSAVRITHLPTGIVVQSQDERSQHRNRDKCMRMLMARLLEVQRQEEESRVADSRRSQIGSGDRSQRIRTYNFPQNRVTDHRINFTLYNLDRMMEGDMENLLTALLEHDMELRMKQRVDASWSGA